MMRILIPFVAALGLSLGVSTGVVMMRAPKVAPMTAADSAKADSLKADSAKAHGGSEHSVAAHDSTHADSAHTEVATTDSTHADSAAQPAPHGAEAKSVPAVAANTPAVDAKDAKGAVKGAPAHAVPAAGPARSARADSTQRVLAKVFASMQAPNAAHILQQMDNGDVQIILASLSPKQQAAILGQFPVERAATIARATLRGEGGN